MTGGAGFIGSHVVDSLIADGCSVAVVDDLSTGSSDRVASEASLRVLDITDARSLDAMFAEVGPDAVFHLAAQSMVTVSVTDPVRDCEVNVVGTLNVLRAATRHGAPVVFTSTGGALYGDQAPRPTPESHLPAPISPYGASKWAAEAYLRTWTLAHRIPHAVCRLGNVYGPRQSPHGEAGVVAILSHALFEGRSPRLFGFGQPTRDYIHVGDVVSCLRAACGAAGFFNVSTGVETSVLEVWYELRKAAGNAVEPDLVSLREGELMHSCMDPSHARQRLGWRPQISLSDGIRSTYEALLSEFEGVR